MYLGQHKQECYYVRPSKLGNLHTYTRVKVWASFRCDNCARVFDRLKQNISPKRLNNNYFHCCSECDSKKFAQRKGVERRKIWDLPVSSELDISRL
jgi:hypothetical protein